MHLTFTQCTAASIYPSVSQAILFFDYHLAARCAQAKRQTFAAKPLKHNNTAHTHAYYWSHHKTQNSQQSSCKRVGGRTDPGTNSLFPRQRRVSHYVRLFACCVTTEPNLTAPAITIFAVIPEPRCLALLLPPFRGMICLLRSNAIALPHSGSDACAYASQH